jgi:branched-chain amino acid transport system ATP-binding protein
MDDRSSLTSASEGAGQLVLSKVAVRFGGVAAVSDVDAVIKPQVITGLIGPNGAGKTTLLNAISGFAPITEGRIELDGISLNGVTAAERAHRGVVRGFQTVRLLERETAFDNILVGCERASQPGFFPQFLNLPSQRRCRERDLAATYDIAERLGLSAVAHRPVAELPFATRRLTEIARILVVRPKVLLLDEPAAGLDTRDRRQLTETLQAYHAASPFTMIVIEHDVDLVRRMCSECVALAQGSVIVTGDPGAVLDSPAVRRAYFGDEAANA